MKHIFPQLSLSHWSYDPHYALRNFSCTRSWSLPKNVLQNMVIKFPPVQKFPFHSGARGKFGASHSVKCLWFVTGPSGTAVMCCAGHCRATGKLVANSCRTSAFRPSVGHSPPPEAVYTAQSPPPLALAIGSFWEKSAVYLLDFSEPESYYHCNLAQSTQGSSDTY